jgi:glycosyltransferase involved in cell wall biosynthesis
VRFLGEVRDVPALLARGSVLVLSSLTEGISLTLLEAMARGLPVVATRVGGNPEVVVDGETGYLVASRDPSQLAARLVQLVENPEIARDMGRRARERVVEHFEVSRMISRYEELYLQCVEQTSRIARNATR